MDAAWKQRGVAAAWHLLGSASSSCARISSSTTSSFVSYASSVCKHTSAYVSGSASAAARISSSATSSLLSSASSVCKHAVDTSQRLGQSAAAGLGGVSRSAVELATGTGRWQGENVAVIEEEPYRAVGPSRGARRQAPCHVNVNSGGVCKQWVEGETATGGVCV